MATTIAESTPERAPWKGKLEDRFPMIPYWRLPHWTVGGNYFSIPIALAAIGILVAHLLLLRRARHAGLQPETAGMMSLVMVVAGAFGAYWFRGVYYADQVKQDWHFLLQFHFSAASFGGIAGGLLAGWIYLLFRRLNRADRLRYLDALAFVFPFGWIIGRCGCILAHDHPGRPAHFFLAVQYPAGARLDLAVIEVLFLGTALIPLFLAMDRRKRPAGFWLGLFFSVYGAFRVALDTLHVDPPRYGPLPVDTWAYGSALVLGCILLRSVTHSEALR